LFKTSYDYYITTDGKLKYPVVNAGWHGTKICAICFNIYFSYVFLQERGLKKRQEEAYEEAREALEDYDATLKQLQDEQEEEETQENSNAKVAGKRAFGPSKKGVARESDKRRRLDSGEKNTDSEGDDGKFDEADPQNFETENDKAEGVQLGIALLDEEQVMAQNAIFKVLNYVLSFPLMLSPQSK
jgi:U3 small nucleolar RNA-associated protein 14